MDEGLAHPEDRGWRAGLVRDGRFLGTFTGQLFHGKSRSLTGPTG